MTPNKKWGTQKCLCAQEPHRSLLSFSISADGEVWWMHNADTPHCEEAKGQRRLCCFSCIAIKSEFYFTQLTNTSCKLWGAILLQKAERMEKFRPVLLKLGSRWEARCITEQITLGASRGLGENPRPGPGRRAATASLPFVLRDVLLLLLWFFLVESSYLNSSH